jgi:hypothetical protein
MTMNRRLFWMHLKVHEVVQGAFHVHHDSHVPHVQQGHMEKFKRFMQHIKLISMNRGMFWMHLQVQIGLPQAVINMYHTTAV